MGGGLLHANTLFNINLIGFQSNTTIIMERFVFFKGKDELSLEISRFSSVIFVKKSLSSVIISVMMRLER